MKIIAKSVKDHEFMYDGKSAHKVSNASAEAICACLNKHEYMLKPTQVWYVHEVDRFDNAYYYAMTQSFERRNGKVVRVVQ